MYARALCAAVVLTRLSSSFSFDNPFYRVLDSNLRGSNRAELLSFNPREDTLALHMRPWIAVDRGLGALHPHIAVDFLVDGQQFRFLF